MPNTEPVTQRCELRTDADLLAALDECRLEHLDVDAARTFVLYREAVLDLRVTGGTLAAARTFTVASPGFAQHVSDPDPETVIAAFCDQMVTVTDTKRH